MEPAQSDPHATSPRSVEQLEDLLSRPAAAVIERFAQTSGDLLVLGAAGKMGPTLARMARRAADLSGAKRRVIAVSRFSKPAERERLERWGVETIRCDLLDDAAVQQLPNCPLVIYMAGMKFGSFGEEPLTWAMNTFLPGMICKRFHSSRIVVFSTGNIYGLSRISGGGATEDDPPSPVGEYAMSCLGRERIAQHFSATLGVPVCILRLNYACELRYGVLPDIATKVWSGQPVDVSMGCFNVIWQADANGAALQALAEASVPATVLNLTGPEMLSVRRAAEQFGRIMAKDPILAGNESDDAILSNAQRALRLFGYPTVGAAQLIEWIADWVMRGGESLSKPTHFETRTGRY